MGKKKTFYTVNQFLERLDNTVTLNTIYIMIRQGKIPIIYVGSRKLIPAEWVNKFCKTFHYEKVAE